MKNAVKTVRRSWIELDWLKCFSPKRAGVTFKACKWSVSVSVKKYNQRPANYSLAAPHARRSMFTVLPCSWLEFETGS
jgi:hypothetical protein